MSRFSLEVLVEEPSMRDFLEVILPRIATDLAVHVRSFDGKHDLIRKLPIRMKAYRRSIQPHERIMVLLDRDGQDCFALKAQLEQIARDAGLVTRSSQGRSGWSVVNRIVVSELEAWYFGDWEAVRQAYPGVPPGVPQKSAFRDPDAIVGGTFRAFERILKRANYFRDGVRKTELAKAIAPYMDPSRNRSHSFRVFRDALYDLAGSP